MHEYPYMCFLCPCVSFPRVSGGWGCRLLGICIVNFRCCQIALKVLVPICISTRSLEEFLLFFVFSPVLDTVRLLIFAHLISETFPHIVVVYILLILAEIKQHFIEWGTIQMPSFVNCLLMYFAPCLLFTFWGGFDNILNLFQIWQLTISVYFLINFNKLYFSRNSSFHLSCKLWWYKVLSKFTYFFNVCRICSDNAFFKFLTVVTCFLSLVSLTRDWLILFCSSKNQLLAFLFSL